MPPESLTLNCNYCFPVLTLSFKISLPSLVFKAINIMKPVNFEISDGRSKVCDFSVS